MSKSRVAALFGAVLALSLIATAPADARRGGSFGSRGSRTYYAPRPTPTAPSYTAPVQRSMTPQPQPSRPGYAPAPGYAPQPRFGGAFGGFGGGFLGGMLTGGLIGGLMGHGFGGGWGGAGMGGGGGLLTILFQLAILGGIVWLVMRLFRRPQTAGTPAWSAAGPAPYDAPSPYAAQSPWGGGPAGYVPTTDPAADPTAGPALQIPITPSDRQAFEQLLMEVQDAFGREDYGALRARTTPEVMSYLAEELSDNATHGRRNQVSGTRLLQSDIAESWREGDTDYATAAMRYEGVDVMVDRNTGAVVEGDASRPTATTELWTFTRPAGGAWKLSAIQETQ